MASSLRQLERHAAKETKGAVRRMIIRNKNERHILSTFFCSQLSKEQCVIISVPCRKLTRVTVLHCPLLRNTDARLTNICHSICEQLEWWIMTITELTISSSCTFEKISLKSTCISFAVSGFQSAGVYQLECKWAPSYKHQRRDVLLKFVDVSEFTLKWNLNNNNFTRRLTCPVCIFTVTRRVLFRTNNVLSTNISEVRASTTFRIGEKIW